MVLHQTKGNSHVCRDQIGAQGSNLQIFLEPTSLQVRSAQAEPSILLRSQIDSLRVSSGSPRDSWSRFVVRRDGYFTEIKSRTWLFCAFQRKRGEPSFDPLSTRGFPRYRSRLTTNLDHKSSNRSGSRLTALSPSTLPPRYVDNSYDPHSLSHGIKNTVFRDKPFTSASIMKHFLSDTLSVCHRSYSSVTARTYLSPLVLSPSFASPAALLIACRGHLDKCNGQGRELGCARLRCLSMDRRNRSIWAYPQFLAIE